MPSLFSDSRRSSRDDPHRARDRLTALTVPTGSSASPRIMAAPGEVAAPEAVAEPVVASDDVAEPEDATPARQARDRAVVRQRLGPLMHRWVPVSLSEARWDPGRPGALLLSAVTALAAVVAAVGVWSSRPVPEPMPALPMLPAVATAGPSTGPSAGPSAGSELVVSVVGEVAEPGLVRVADGARVADALEAAGGTLRGTDTTALNLARLLSDGEQLLVGVDPPPGRPVAGDAGAEASPGAIDLNTATAGELETLPGIGPVTAQRIIDWRTANGRFTSVDQLLEISGIGDAKLAQLEGLVRV